LFFHVGVRMFCGNMVVVVQAFIIPLA